ncbi:MAG TPA: hypothetical protein VIV65_03370 [Gemmatimonadaceae bacterium]|jgi:hypothetical protein
MRTTIRIALAIAAAASLAACGTVSQRAMANGRFNDNGRAYSELMSGRQGISNSRALRSSFNQLPWASQERAYPPFGTWRY